MSEYPTPTNEPGPPSAYAREIELRRAKSIESASETALALTCAYANDDVFVLDKPPSAYVDDVLRAVRENRITRIDVDRRSRTRDDALADEHTKMMHRLDRDTSGALVFARNSDATRSLAGQFARGDVKKWYVALCATTGGTDVGSREERETVRVETGHGRARYGLFRLYNARDVDRELPGNNRVKRAVTMIEIESAVENADVVYCEAERGARRARLVLARCSPITGRTHQIRLHCASLGLPLVGDVRYGGPIELESSSRWLIGGESVRGALLHAESVTFRHPRHDVDVVVVSPRPPWAHISSDRHP